MTESKHTPGPWTVQKPPSTASQLPMDIVDSAGYLICKVYSPVLFRGQDARLIAALPELLALVRETAGRCLCALHEEDNLASRCRELIEKVEP